MYPIVSIPLKSMYRRVLKGAMRAVPRLPWCPARSTRLLPHHNRSRKTRCTQNLISGPEQSNTEADCRSTSQKLRILISRHASTPPYQNSIDVKSGAIKQWIQPFTTTNKSVQSARSEPGAHRSRLGLIGVVEAVQRGKILDIVRSIDRSGTHVRQKTRHKAKEQSKRHERFRTKSTEVRTKHKTR